MCSVDLITGEGDGLAVAVLSGALDVTGAAAVAAELCAAVSGGRLIAVDLAGLEFIDTSGLAALVSARRDARRVGGDLLLAAPQGPVLRILSITRLIDDFSVYASLHEAAASTRRGDAAAREAASPGLLPAT